MEPWLGGRVCVLCRTGNCSVTARIKIGSGWFVVSLDFWVYFSFFFAPWPSLYPAIRL